MKIIIGADFVPTESNFELFKAGDADKLFGSELMELLNNTDYRIFNLETPLTDKLNSIPKYGPNLSAPTACVKGYQAAKADLLTLANNHIMDQNVIGLQSTIETLKLSGIPYLGAGKNLTEAETPYFIERNEEIIGIYACAEHEFSIAEANYPGANPYDPLESFDAVKSLSENCNYTIVLYHGGKENYRYPSPELQKRCRKFIEKGADLVICQHSHCIGCEEKYLSGTIIYGQGNFLFDHSERETWQTGLLIAVNNRKISYIPLCKNNNTVRLAKDKEADEILNGFFTRSEEIKETGFIEKKFSELVKKEYYSYLEILSGNRKKFLYRALKKISNGKISESYMQKYFDIKTLLSVENFIYCETHYECIVKSLIINRKNDYYRNGKIENL